MSDLKTPASASQQANVVLQPAGSTARRNLERSVYSPVHRDEWRAYLSPEDAAVLDMEHPTGLVPMWGTTAGIDDGMRTRWNRMRAGDLVMFLKNGEAYLAATVTHKWESAPLADALWPPKPVGDRFLSWKLMFSFTKPRPVNISYERMTKAADTGREIATRSFMVYQAPISERVAALLEVDDRALIRPVGEVDVAAMVRRFDAVDVEMTANRRLEQAYLRNLVIPGSTARCALCGRSMDADYLVAAHIKKRSDCTLEEKIDLPAVAMAACRFGCDELYERGHIWVDDRGRIRASRHLSDKTARDYWQQHLRDAEVVDWASRQQSHKYFAAHREALRTARFEDDKR